MEKSVVDKSVVVVAVLLTAFIIDRLIAALMFIGTYLTLPKGPSEKRSEYNRKTIYFGLSAILSAVALSFIPYQSLDLVGLTSPYKDAVMWLILVGGADRISALIGSGASAPPPAAKPKGEFHVAGTLKVDE
jgi:hypothetical protein